MTTISVSLTEQHAALVEASIASGDYASASEVVRMALGEFFAVDAVPPVAEMAAEIDGMDREIAAGEALLSPGDVRAELTRRRG